MLEPNGTFWIQLVNFAIFFAVLNAIFLRPVGAAVRKRREYIESVTSDYDRYCEEAAQLQAQAEATRAAARREGEQTLIRARAEASNEAASLATQYSGQVQQIVEQAHQTVSSELQSAKANEEKIVIELANMLVDRAISEAV